MNNNRFKFRVWNKLSKRFCLDTEDGYFGQEEDFANGIFIVSSFNNDDVIQQFTGYQDSEGNDIYEGDILKNMIPDKYAVNLFVVKWSEFEPNDDMGVGGIGFVLPWFYCNFKPKTIGNIFENSELVK